MKRFTFIIALLGIALMGFAKPTNEAKETLKTTKEAVSTFHQDVKDAISVTHDDVKAITTTLYGDGKDAVTSLYPDVKSAVVAIGRAIGVAAEHVYVVLVKKFVVDAIVQSLPFLLGLLLIITSWFKLNQFFKIDDKVRWNKAIYPFLLLIFGIICLCNVDYNVMVMGLVNPEYGALNYILEYSKEMLK